MHPVLDEIFHTKQIIRPDGSTVPFDVSISIDEGAALQRIIREVKPAVTLEIGLARGISAVFICEALRDVGGTRHIVIDPGPVTGWNDVGLHTIERAGYSSMIEFHNEPSHQVLPRLERQGERVGVALIDGWHTFDYVLVDFFYVDRILNVGGVVMFDDAWSYPAIRKVTRYVATHRRYKVVADQSAPSHPASWRRRILSRLSGVFRTPPLRSLSRHVVRADVLQPDSALQLAAQDHIAFRKLGDDLLGDGREGTRGWDQHLEF